jgi:hypothetical protein
VVTKVGKIPLERLDSLANTKFKRKRYNELTLKKLKDQNKHIKETEAMCYQKKKI